MWPVLAGLARLLPPEAAHNAAVKTLALGIGPKPDLPSMPVTVAGLTFDNPIGLAAGFDKNAAAYKGALRLGFGHVEVGTITPKPQPGNPQPRVFRLPEDGAVINRYGFNGNGMRAAARNLARVRDHVGVLGVNVGANKTSIAPDDDYRIAVSHLARYADYVTLNISSPNTPGLRDLQAERALKNLLAAGREGMELAGVTRPLFLKMAPDLSPAEIDAIVDVCCDGGVSGIIATNTTISRPDSLHSKFAPQAGGLSGQPLFEMSTQVLAQVAARANGRLAVIGVGGVASGWQAYAKLLVGADLVQLYSGLALEGPTLPGRIVTELATLMAADGVKDIADVRGRIADPAAAITHASLLAQNAA